MNALCHGIDNIDWLFPEDHLLDTPPRIIDKPDDWVSVVMGGVKHIPFSRFKSLFADLTEDDARAKGYLKVTTRRKRCSACCAAPPARPRCIRSRSWIATMW